MYGDGYGGWDGGRGGGWDGDDWDDDFDPPVSPVIRCPTCLGMIDWPDGDEVEPFRYNEVSGEYVKIGDEELDRYRFNDRDPRRTRFRRWLDSTYIRCENPFGDDEHFLAYSYGWYGDPLVVGMVGRTRVGKSHLLAAMIGQLTSQHGLADLGLTFTPVDRRRHQAYMKSSVDLLLTGSQVLPATPPTQEPARFVDALMIYNSRTELSRTVAFFDISGEDFPDDRRSADFVAVASALMFVIDPEQAGLLGNASRRDNEEAFDAVLGRLVKVGRRDRASGLFDLDAAVVVNKSDQIRFEPGVRHWYGNQREPGFVDTDEIFDESADVFALLHSRRAESWLAPVRQCRRTTLHFASATGSNETPSQTGQQVRTFRRKVRPSRVVEPMLALLAMAGILGDDMFEGRHRQVGI